MRPSPTPLTREQRIRHESRLREAGDNILVANAVLDQRVIDARRDGASWYFIAAALGFSRQSTQERFQKLPELALDLDPDRQ